MQRCVYNGQLLVFCCGLGKQKPYVHSGMLGEGEVEAKNTNRCFSASQGRRTAAANRLDLPTSAYTWCGAGWGHWPQTPAKIQSQLEPSNTPASALLRGGCSPGIHIQGLRRGGDTVTDTCTLKQTGISSLLRPLLLFSTQPQCCCCFIF